MRVREENLLADRGLVRKGRLVESLLGACWKGTDDPGPYELNERTNNPDWSRVLQGDRFYALAQIRGITYGWNYDFSVPCESCRENIDWTVDIRELPVQRFDDEASERFKAGNRFETVLDVEDENGNVKKFRVFFKLITGLEERKIPALTQHNRDRMSEAVLRMRVLEVEGVEPKDLRKWIADLDGGAADDLREAFDEADLGIETSIEIECPNCMRLQDVDIPFGQGFFVRSRRRRKGDR